MFAVGMDSISFRPGLLSCFPQPEFPGEYSLKLILEDFGGKLFFWNWKKKKLWNIKISISFKVYQRTLSVKVMTLPNQILWVNPDLMEQYACRCDLHPEKASHRQQGLCGPRAPAAPSPLSRKLLVRLCPVSLSSDKIIIFFELECSGYKTRQKIHIWWLG